MPQFGALEAGGTKFVCGVGSGPQDLRTIQIPTTTPDETIRRCVEFFRARTGARPAPANLPGTSPDARRGSKASVVRAYSSEESGELAALGIGAFGPIDRERGTITSTPKAGWRNCDLAGPFRAALGVPVAFDSDVKAAIIGEARWGAARAIENCLYLTIGTGIGGATLLSRSEMGHLRIPRLPEDAAFAGICPFHGDCLEGIASGPAIAARCGQPGETLPADHPVWQIEAKYLALGIANLTFAFAPERVILGGGVMQQPHLLDRIRVQLDVLLNNYIAAPELVLPALRKLSGVLGALAMANTIANAMLQTPAQARDPHPRI